MNLIDNLTGEPTQITTLDLGDGTFAVLTLAYRPSVQRWVISITDGEFEVDGINLCVSPNALRQWKNQIEFGIMCISTDGLDPFFIDDFTSGRVSLYLLNAADVASFEASFFGSGVAPTS